MKSTGRIPRDTSSRPRMTPSRVCTSAGAWAPNDPSTQNKVIHSRPGTFVSVTELYKSEWGTLLHFRSLFLTESCSFEETGAARHLWLHRLRNHYHHPGMHRSQSLPQTRWVYSLWMYLWAICWAFTSAEIQKSRQILHTGPLSDHFKWIRSTLLLESQLVRRTSILSPYLVQASMSWHIFSCRTAKDEYKPDENDLFLPMNHLKDGEGT